MMDAIEEILVAMVFASYVRAQFKEVRHEDLEPARYIIFDRDTGAISHVFTLSRGEAVLVHRGRRLLVEPVFQVPQRHPMRHLQTWWTA